MQRNFLKNQKIISIVSVEIKFEPQGVLHSKFRGSNKKLPIDYIHIKWGQDHRSGSEHTILGVRHAGEVRKIIFSLLQRFTRFFKSFINRKPGTFFEKPIVLNELLRCNAAKLMWAAASVMGYRNLK